MPAPVQAKMESAFGADFSSVRIHEGQAATELGAAAYTQGRDIHFAPGQYDPGSTAGQELLGHELAHVVQQSEGRVQPTVQGKGVFLGEDSALEQEADARGARAARGEPAAMAAAGGSVAIDAPAGAPVQRKPVATAAGLYNDEEFTPIKQSSGKEVGVKFTLSFTPNEKVDATKIGMVQAAKSYSEESPVHMSDSNKARTVGEGPGEGYGIDRARGYDSPVYGSAHDPAQKDLTDTAMDNAPKGETADVSSTGNASYQLGYRRKLPDGSWDTKAAKMNDAPQLGSRGANAGQEFETTALALDGEQKGSYYGSVRWGWQSDAQGTFSKIDLVKVSDGDPSANFTQAAKLWNKQKFLPCIQKPKADGSTVTTSEMTVTKGGRTFKLAALTKLNISPDAATAGNDMLVTLADSFQIVDGGVHFMAFIEKDKLEGDTLKADTVMEFHGHPATVAAGSKLNVTDSVVGDRVLVMLAEATLEAVDLHHRLVWAEILDLKGGSTHDLPVP